MQLTPRNLVMACGAMLAGGAVFGVITTLAPAVSLPTATGATPTPTATATADGLGDEEITYPASVGAGHERVADADRRRPRGDVPVRHSFADAGIAIRHYDGSPVD